MIIVTNQRFDLDDPSFKFMSYDEFERQATSDEGLDVDDDLIININEIDPEIFEAIDGSEGFSFFTLNGYGPEFCEGCQSDIEDWSEAIDPDSLYDYREVEEDEEPKVKTKKKQKIEDEEEDQGYLQNEVETSFKSELTEEAASSIINLIDSADESSIDSSSGGKDAKIYVFGSSKGGTGKTFTSIISTYRYAKTHPHERIALVDFDIIDGQVGISIHKIKPTMRKYYTEYQKGYRDFRTMREFAVKGNSTYPQNVDFYLAPNSGAVIQNDDFWINIIQNCIENYDVVVFDTGIDYLNIKPISYVYKIADKINLVTTTSIKSINSVTKQISRLKGEIPNTVFTEEDEIGPRLNVIMTQLMPTNPLNKDLIGKLAQKCNVLATFGVMTDSISQAEFFGKWEIFDNNGAINKSLDNIMQ